MKLIDLYLVVCFLILVSIYPGPWFVLAFIGANAATLIALYLIDLPISYLIDLSLSVYSATRTETEPPPAPDDRGRFSVLHRHATGIELVDDNYRTLAEAIAEADRLQADHTGCPLAYWFVTRTGSVPVLTKNGARTLHKTERTKTK